MEFKEGLYTYVKVIKDNDPKIKLEQFLLCTSCTTSYIFGKPDGYSVPEASGDSPMTLTPIEGGLPVPVTYVPTNLSMMGGEDGDTEYNWKMDVAWIDPKYQTIDYFYHPKENVLGLALTDTTGLPNEA